MFKKPVTLALLVTMGSSRLRGTLPRAGLVQHVVNARASLLAASHPGDEPSVGLIQSVRWAVLPRGHAKTSTPASTAASLGQLRDLIQAARRQALRVVDALQVRTCWEIGRHIVEFQQQGADRAAYGARLIATLAARVGYVRIEETDDPELAFDRRNHQSLERLVHP